MCKAIEFGPAYKVEWVVSPLQETPFVEYFDFWDEIQDWASDMELNCEAFNLEYVKIYDLTKQESV